MQILIEIDEEDYNRLKEIPYVFDSLVSRLYNAVKNGTPLPKNHGRLIDADAIWDHVPDITNPLENHLTTYDLQSIIKETPTIIEAEVKVDEDRT